MLPSALTTIFFSLSVIFGARSAKALGARNANLARITLATVALALWAHVFGGGLSGPGLPWYFLSGVIGFGLGDMALFGALPRIGPRLAILLTQCLAAPIAALVEWSWLGTRLGAADLLSAAVILLGVAFALAPDGGLKIAPRVFWLGALFGLGSAFGQALGAVLSRRAVLAAHLTGGAVDGGTAAYQRIIGGLLLTWLFGAFGMWRERRRSGAPPDWKAGAPLAAANALAGPTIGVACYQWALKTTASGKVLPVVATSPLVTMLLAWWIDSTRPTRRATIGGLLAVLGVIAMQLNQHAR